MGRAQEELFHTWLTQIKMKWTQKLWCQVLNRGQRHASQGISKEKYILTGAVFLLTACDRCNPVVLQWPGFRCWNEPRLLIGWLPCSNFWRIEAWMTQFRMLEQTMAADWLEGMFQHLRNPVLIGWRCFNIVPTFREDRDFFSAISLPTHVYSFIFSLFLYCWTEFLHTTGRTITEQLSIQNSCIPGPFSTLPFSYNKGSLANLV